MALVPGARSSRTSRWWHREHGAGERPRGGWRAGRARRPPGFGGAQRLCAASWPWPERCGLGLAGSGTGVTAGQAGPRNPHGYQGRHESTLLSRQPWRGQECKGMCAGLWMNCANAQDGGAMPGGMPGEPLGRPCPRISSADAGDLTGCGTIRKAVATVPAPDSYPHVTCGGGPQASTRCSCHGRPGGGSFTPAGCAKLSGSRTGRGRARSGTGPGPAVPAAGRTGPTRPFRSGWAWCSPTGR
jgi:hypothetical protein